MHKMSKLTRKPQSTKPCFLSIKTVVFYFHIPNQSRKLENLRAPNTVFFIAQKRWLSIADWYWYYYADYYYYDYYYYYYYYYA